MMNTVPTNSNADFFQQLSTYQQGAKPPRPVYVRLDGKSGVWNELTFSESEKKNVKIAWHDGEKFEAAILMVKWFASDKYKEGSTIKRRTREFGSWDEKVEYIEIDFLNKQDGPKVIGSFPDYRAFKEYLQVEYGRKVNEALALKMPIPQQNDYKADLWASVYVYDFVKDRIVNVKLKGTSRKAVFDYLGDWNRNAGVSSISQVMTEFSSIQFTEPQPYYAAKLRMSRVLSEGEQTKVKEAVMALVGWMKSFEEGEDMEPQKQEANDVKTDEPPF